MVLFQTLLVLVFLVAIAKVIGRYRAEELSKRGAITWVLFWIVGIVVVLYPNITARAAELFGIGRGADLVVYLSLASLFLIVFRLMIKIEKLNREITQVVRKEALKK